ncbi:AtpZ/AtpI family protein [Roseibium sp.]|uniref:AtpZ/AtpI family protein n=1 Tax=Roseibium sp. TaxID=1936156 RepID=UPI003A97A064
MSNSTQNNGSDGQDDGLSQAELAERRDRLNRQLDDRRVADEKEALARSKSDTKGYAQAMKISSEFIAGIVVGGGIGWVLDRWLDTGPFGLIVFLLLGFAAGVLNVLRSAGYVAEPERKIGEMPKGTSKTDEAGSK